jgi:hypothetical protein
MHCRHSGSTPSSLLRERDVLQPHTGEPSLRQGWPTCAISCTGRPAEKCMEHARIGPQAEKGQEQQTREGLEEHTHKRTRLAVDPRPSRQCRTAANEAANEMTGSRRDVEKPSRKRERLSGRRPRAATQRWPRGACTRAIPAGRSPVAWSTSLSRTA